MIANFDEDLDRLESFLKSNNIRDNTIVLFLTDNGTASGAKVFNAGMRGNKMQLYDFKKSDPSCAEEQQLNFQRDRQSGYTVLTPDFERLEYAAGGQLRNPDVGE